jgi:ABC-type transporter Mla subunit MlaD
MTLEHPIILLMIVFTMIMSCHLIATIANAVKAHHARRQYLREIVPSLHQIVQDLNVLQNDLRDFLDRFDTMAVPSTGNAPINLSSTPSPG